MTLDQGSSDIYMHIYIFLNMGNADFISSTVVLGLMGALGPKYILSGHMDSYR